MNADPKIPKGKALVRAIVKGFAALEKKFGKEAMGGGTDIREGSRYPKQNSDALDAAAPDHVKKRLAEVEAAGQK